nr:ankyrin repeat domain-containing protein [Dehalococcoidia bacterium]
MKHVLITTIAAVLVVGCGPGVNIHEAARTGNIEAVKQHIAAGTDVNAKDKYGESPLLFAATFGHKEIAELLIANGADVNTKIDKIGMTPLHIATGQGYKEIVELLIAKGADVNAVIESGGLKGKTPLGLAWRHHPEVTDFLRKHGGKTGAWLNAYNSIHA